MLRRWQYVDRFRRRARRGKEMHFTDLLANNNIMSMCRGVRNPVSLPQSGTQVYVNKCTELGVVPNSKVSEAMNVVCCRLQSDECTVLHAHAYGHE